MQVLLTFASYQQLLIAASVTCIFLMPDARNPTRQRLIQAALELFAAQGVTDTTTRQIAESAGVNEVTLFRHFGNKHGLLLAVIEEAAVFTQLGQTLVQQATPTGDLNQALKEYAIACLQALERVPEMVRSVVGEAGQYPSENREALGRGFTQANRYVAAYFETVIRQGHCRTHLSAENLASLLNGMLLGYAVIEFTSEFHHLWQDREEFLENLVTLFLHGAVSPVSQSGTSQAGLGTITPRVFHGSEEVADLPAKVVHAILQRAKKRSLQDYAIAYVLFGAGLSPKEVVQLQRSQYINDADQQILRVMRESLRSVPVNQWISGKRYGSYVKNPLTQWLKSRKDQSAALFLNATDQPLTEVELRQQWQELTRDLMIDSQDVSATVPSELRSALIEQAQPTWCVEMLMRGMSVESLQILTGWESNQLQHYVQRAREKAALEEAIRLDQKV
jgi:AcrR family transcriptional regulator